MKATTLVPAAISVEEYLSTAYRPDCDYVDGEVIERNLGEFPHSNLQTEFAHYFRTRRKQWNVVAVVEQRVQVGPTRFRIPDVCVVSTAERSPIFKAPPIICIEVLSPKDRQSRVQQRVDDYLKFGVRYVWVVDPVTRRVWSYTTTGSTEIKDGMLRTENPDMTVNLMEVFAELEP